jgi:hypothetical protein
MQFDFADLLLVSLLDFLVEGGVGGGVVAGCYEALQKIIII